MKISSATPYVSGLFFARVLGRAFLWVFCFTVPVSAYVLQMDRNSRGQIVSIRWGSNEVRNGISFWVDANSFPFSKTQTQQAINASISVWSAVPTAQVVLQNRGEGNFDPVATDRRNVILYDAVGSEFEAPQGTGVIAFTRINWDDSGEIFDADIVFNGRDFGFSVGSENPTGGQIDLQSVLTHELGHFLGLDHSGLQGSPSVRPTMYPFYFGSERSLETDDKAGLAALYPSVATLTGTMEGRVTDQRGLGVLGAHVVAYRAGTDTFAVAVLSGTAGVRKGEGGDGEYKMEGLPPGEYQVAIEPLNGSVTARNLGGIFDRLNTDFPREFYNNASVQSVAQAIRVSAGGRATGIDFVLGRTVPGFPAIEDLVFPNNTPDPVGPYRFQARVTDNGVVSAVDLLYRINSGSVQTLSMRPMSGNLYVVDLGGFARGTAVAYRLRARDTDGNETLFPPQELPMQRFEVLSLSGEPLLYTALRYSHMLSVFDTGLKKEVARIPTGNTPLSVLITPDENYLFVSNNGLNEDGTNNAVTVVETATHRVAATIRAGSEPLDLAVSPDGRRVYVTNSTGGSVSVLDASGLRESRRISVTTSREGPFGIAVSPDGKRLYVTDIDGSQVVVLDEGTGQALTRINVVASPRSLTMAPASNRLYVAGFDGGISEIDTGTDQVVRTFSTGTASIFRVKLSPDGKRLYAADRLHARVLVIDVSTGQIVSTLQAGGVETRDLAISSDGHRLYVSNQDSDDLVIFDTRTGQVVGAYALSDGPRGIAVRNRPVYQVAVLEDAIRADFNADGRVDFSDFVLFVRAYGTRIEDNTFDATFDLNRNERVDFADFILFAGVFGQVVKQ